MSLPDTDMITINDARHTIEYQLNQLVRLVDDLLDVSRIITGKIKLRLNFVDLAHLVRYAVESSKYFIESRGHKLTISLPTEPILLKVDEMRLLQVRSNLLNNAAKYTERNGNIWLSAQYKDKDLTISVKDTGIGIDADMLPHIFDMFSQIDSSIERSQGGIGIGLALVKNIVEMYGGTVTAVSAGPGKGAEFTIWIPNIIVPEETKPSLSTEESHTLLPSKQHHKRVLVVDDNEPSAKTMGKMVESLGHKVKIAYDGITAIAVAKEFLPHVILMDIGLPIMNGYDVCRALRKEPLLKDTIIAAQTGWGQEEHLRLSKEAGFNYHFIKPVTLATLKAALNGQKSNLLDF
jgi:CheY-like chemotaxis protein